MCLLCAAGGFLSTMLRSNGFHGCLMSAARLTFSRSAAGLLGESLGRSG
jgi:hypothetical protein